MSSTPGLVGYSQDPSGTPGQSEEAAAREEFESIKPRAEERANDARKNASKSVRNASNAEYGPNQRSDAFKCGEKIGIDVGTENSAGGTTAVPEPADRTDSGKSKRSEKAGREVPASINPHSKEPNPGDYYGSTGGY
ncbi:hypothetical protein TWF225_008403 [Orbilia oligospora]|nr:hypothetical protein TWF225_008403 [Orbilia oligospora]KAF3244484.1 hypothetical protein TWF217_010724 [Orbilia oligospora]KAF3268206.1 hypothetical protein TWF128_008209 [Orbilia oligospora]